MIENFFFKLTCFDNHAIINSEDDVILIDTGSPATIHKSNNIIFLGQSFDTSTDLMGMTNETISELLGMHVTTLLGTDILRNFKMLFDYRNAEVRFSRNDFDFSGQISPINTIMGVPLVELEVAGNKVNCALDTGAKISYLASTLTTSYTSVGKERDFYPGLGNFETECYNIDTALGEEHFLVKYGNLPGVLEMALMMTGMKGVIGSDLFRNFKVLVDLENCKIVCQKY